MPEEIRPSCVLPSVILLMQFQVLMDWKGWFGKMVGVAVRDKSGSFQGKARLVVVACER